MEEFLVAVCTSAPAKVLFSGTDELLTTSLRGGLNWEEEILMENKTSHEPVTNDVIGLKVVAKAVAPEEFEVASLVVKGEEQNADGALVPVRLWDQAFLRGYGQEGNDHLCCVIK
jgi:hypothetical protein